MSASSGYAEIPASDEELLRRAKTHSRTFESLWNDEYPTEQATKEDQVFGLCTLLAREQRGYPEGGDPEQIKRAAKQSALVNDEIIGKLDGIVDESIDWADIYWDRSTPYSGQYQPKRCIPPRYNPSPFKKRRHRAEFEGERYDDFIESSGPIGWEDSPGTGKTISSSRGAASDDRAHAILFRTHRKAREFILDENSPRGYFHLKGAEQPRYNCCLDARIEARWNESAFCQEHGNQNKWHKMCPLYEKNPDDEIRERLEALTIIKGHKAAHDLLCSEDKCEWAKQFDGLKDKKRVVGVHEYQKIFADEDHDVILDETLRLLTTKSSYSVVDLKKAASLIRNAREDIDILIADFIDGNKISLTDAIVKGELDAVDPPDYSSTDIAERLVRLKIEFNEGLDWQLEYNDWDGTPPCFDAILATLAEIGFEPEACREAIAGQNTLDRCPRCDAPTEMRGEYDEREHHCMNCAWNDARFSILDAPKERKKTRAIAYVETDDNPEIKENQLCFKSLPDPSELPDDPLLLDATATPEKIAGLYQISVDEVEIQGDDSLELNAQITQIVDGQFHRTTIEQSITDDNRNTLPDDEWRSPGDRLQKALKTICEEHKHPLVVMERRLIPHFDIPENAEVMYYHAVRGLNRKECDAVVCIGAPHPNPKGIEREAKLLAMDHPDLETGGVEHSTRNGAPNEPIYRKFNYRDEQGRGFAIPTKRYSGFMGTLFYEKREKELVQTVHRIRPISTDGNHVYLLTNVPTDLPVDTLVELDYLTDPQFQSLLPIPENAIDHFVEPLYELLTGDIPDGFDTDLLLEQTDEEITTDIEGLTELVRTKKANKSKGTVQRWANKLVDLGLLNKGSYEQREGYRYAAERSTFTRALLLFRSYAGVKVDAAQTFEKKARTANGSLEWLNWATEEFVEDAK